MEEFIKELSFTRGKYRETDIFTDLIKLTSYFIQVNILAQTKYDKNYKEILNKYNQDEQQKMTILIIKLCELFEKQEYPSDILGKIFHSINANNKQLGQFFTPQHLQELCSTLVGLNEIQTKDYITINEPSCGSGGMVIAYAKYLKKNKCDYTQKMLVYAKDLDLLCFHMCYVQLSMYDIPAIVECGDTLAETTNEKFETPQFFFGGWKLRESEQNEGVCSI